MNETQAHVNRRTGLTAENTGSSSDGEETRTLQAALKSDAIFNGQREVVISHNGVQYRLRITASDKLILTK